MSRAIKVATGLCVAILLTGFALAAAPLSGMGPEPPYQLENGLTVILRPVPVANRVAVVVLFDLGTENDPAGKSGLTHLLEHLYCTAAAGDAPAREFAEIMKRYAAGFNQYTGPDFTVFAGVVAAGKLEEELKDAAARMGALHLSGADLGREVPRVLSELENMYVRAPSLVGLNRVRTALHPIAQDGRRGGNPEQVKRLTLDELQAFWQAHYKPRNAILVLAGRFDAGEARELIRRHFGPMPSGELPPAAPSATARHAPDTGTVKRIRVNPLVPGTAGVVSIGYAAPRPGSDDYAPFLLVVSCLRMNGTAAGGGLVPPVFYPPLDDPTTLVLQAELPSGKDADAVLGQLDARLQAALKAKVGPQDKLWATNSMSMLGTVELPDLMRFDDLYGLAFSVGRQRQLRIDGGALRAAIEHVTDADLQRLATTIFAPAKRVAVIVEVEKAFVHPGILHSRAELEFVKAKVKAEQEPWKTAWEQLRSRPTCQLSWTPKPIAHVFRGPYNRPDVGGSNLQRDASAAYSHALEWFITDKPAHAEKAIEILNAYARTLKSVGEHDARLLVGMSGIHFLTAAELVHHTYTGWTPEDQKRFEQLVRTVLYPIIKDFYPTANGNWDAAMIQTMLAMGIFLDDHVIFDRAVEYYLKGEGNGAIGKYFNDFGECQESGRDQAHTQMGLGYLGCAAEIAWKQGVDLHGALDNRLALGFEYTAKYNLGFDVPYRPYRSVDGRYNNPAISPTARGRFAPIYERAYHHYHDRRGMEMPFTKQVLEKTRPESWELHHMPWGTLMFEGLPAD